MGKNGIAFHLGGTWLREGKLTGLVAKGEGGNVTRIVVTLTNKTGKAEGPKSLHHAHHNED